jgi:hypothetical protein
LTTLPPLGGAVHCRGQNDLPTNGGPRSGTFSCLRVLALVFPRARVRLGSLSPEVATRKGDIRALKRLFVQGKISPVESHLRTSLSPSLASGEVSARLCWRRQISMVLERVAGAIGNELR